LGEDFAGRVGFDLGVEAQTGAGPRGIGEVAEEDMKTVGGFFDGGFGETRGLEEAAGDGSVAGGV
jgi:hypothetical protein